jgi:hypothetical protein
VTAYNDDSLQIVDISTPSSPSEVAYIQDATRLNGATNVVVSGSLAYVTSFIDDSLQIIDISTPASPTLTGQLTDDATNMLNGASGIAVS